ncbi:MAG: nucleotide exchange factor GrpE [Candidatus Omnitrophota bacterium]
MSEHDKNNAKEPLPEEVVEKLQQEGNKEQTEAPGEDYQALWNKYVRACADFSNARKRWDREKEDIVKFSNSSLMRDLLIILDETEQALKMAATHHSSEDILKGLEMTYNNFIGVLKKRGLQAITAVGKDFDPHFHEIIATKEVDSNISKPVVLEEIQKGYLFEDKVLRSAKVIVGIQREEQKADNKEQKADSKGQKTDNKGQKAEKSDSGL